VEMVDFVCLLSALTCRRSWVRIWVWVVDADMRNVATVHVAVKRACYIESWIHKQSIIL